MRTEKLYNRSNSIVLNVTTNGNKDITRFIEENSLPTTNLYFNIFFLRHTWHPCLCADAHLIFARINEYIELHREKKNVCTLIPAEDCEAAALHLECVFCDCITFHSLREYIDSIFNGKVKCIKSICL